jgi:hypothetical protein
MFFLLDMFLRVNRLLENRPPLRLMTRSGMGVERGGAVLYRGAAVRNSFKDLELDLVDAELSPGDKFKRASISRAEKTARSIERTHGRRALERLIEGLLTQESGESIGEALGVSRQRVHQWKMILVREVTFVELAPGLRQILEPEVSPPQ